ncbi:hypothetical protein DPMN_089482 [Dreissena polymorpha]|uniref:Uncharacterized protein n=1 Tax=Dreissena polymorpha TaxID=45954 RepID=A0A9D4KWI3_DREPO|nr:hypothetical protein DPMN_089482 [Dreissena polymorpha]
MPNNNVQEWSKDVRDCCAKISVDRKLFRTKIARANKKTALPPGCHVFQPTSTIFELIQDIIGTHLLTKFHEIRLLLNTNQSSSELNVVSRVLTRNNSPLSGGHVFQPTGIFFKLVQNNIEQNLLTKFHEDRTINVASKVKNAPLPNGHFHDDFTKAIYGQNAPPLGSHPNLLTKFHEDWTINVDSRVLTRKNAPPLVAMLLKQPKPFSN